MSRLRPPRALYVDFPLGRPLGRPHDKALQRRVLDAAFGLLSRSSGPVLERFPEEIEEDESDLVACTVPPRLDPEEVPAVDEARALLPAYMRAVQAAGGRTTVGRVVDATGIPEAVRAITRLGSGVSWADCGHPGIPPDVVLDIRAYYEEAATALVGHVPAARAAEAWFHRHTEAGRSVLAAQRVLRTEQGADGYQLSLYMSPVEEALPTETADSAT